MSREQHLMTASLRKTRVLEKRQLILRFLRDEIWSDTSNLSLLLNVKSVACTRTMNKLLKDQLIRSHILPTLGGQIVLFGITTHGQALAAEEGEEILDKVFAPSRVAPTYARHTLDIQTLRILAERAGWTQWVNADRIDKWETGKMRPDAYALSPDGKRFGIECERTIKSPKRYVQILNSWLQAIRRGEVQRVVWVAPTDIIRDRLRQIITSITHVEVSGQSVLIPRDRFENIDFQTYSEWPKS